MPKNVRLIAICICLACSGGRSIGGAPKPDGSWTIGAPIVTYWCGPGGTMPVDDQSVAQLAAGGWNLGWARNRAELDVYYRHGLRASLVIGAPDIDDPARAKALDATIQQVRHHPALYAYHLVDEPSATTFPRLGKLVAHLRKLDPATLAYINLFPTYASNDTLGAPGYDAYLKQFVDVVRPSLLSYDHYLFMKNSDGDQYFHNLALVREAAIRARLPFLNVIQACDSPAEGWRGPNENEIRWLTYTSLAYGAQGISHFRYDIGLCRDAGLPNALFWPVSRSNRGFVAIARELQPLTSIGIYHCGRPGYSGSPLPKGSPFAPESIPAELLLGYFGSSADRPTHVLVVNLDYGKAVTATLTGPGPMNVFHAPTQVWCEGSAEARAKLDLPPGGGTLIRLHAPR